MKPNPVRQYLFPGSGHGQRHSDPRLSRPRAHNGDTRLGRRAASCCGWGADLGSARHHAKAALGSVRWQGHGFEGQASVGRRTGGSHESDSQSQSGWCHTPVPVFPAHNPIDCAYHTRHNSSGVGIAPIEPGRGRDHAVSHRVVGGKSGHGDAPIVGSWSIGPSTSHLRRSEQILNAQEGGQNAFR
jgi:hypothetical protein